MSTTDKGTSYEQFVHEIQTAILSAQSVSTITVEHDKNIRGLHSGTDHQIDVYWEYRLGGITHKVAIECKNWNKPIDIGVIRNLKGALDDIPGLRGIVVSPEGFQQGAIDYARAHGISLKIIRKPLSAGGDYAGEGWVNPRKIRMDLITLTKDIVDLKIHVDKEWIAAAENTEIKERYLGKPLQGTSDEFSVEIITADSTKNLRITQLFDEVKIPEQLKDDEVYHYEFHWENAWLKPNATDRLKLKGLDFDYKLRKSKPVTISMSKEEANGIIKDIIENTLLIVEPDGTIIGDTEKEGIPGKG